MLVSRYGESSKVQGKKVRKFKEVQISTPTPILICNPGAARQEVLVRFDHPGLLAAFRVKLNMFERLFFTLDVADNSSVTSALVTITIMFSILLSVMVFLIGSHPNFHDVSPRCAAIPADQRPCADEDYGCLSDCEPTPTALLQSLESLCIWVFTLVERFDIEPFSDFSAK